MKERLMSIFEGLGIDISLFDSQHNKMSDMCDSIQFVVLISDIEGQFNVEIPDEMLDIDVTIDEFIDKTLSLIC